MIITIDEIYEKLERYGEFNSEFTLELKNLGLSELPENVSLKIGHLYLDNNQLTRVPDWVVESTLMEVSLKNNQINSLNKKQCKNADRYKKIVNLDNNDLLEYQLRNQEKIMMLNNEYCLKRGQVIKTKKIKEIKELLKNYSTKIKINPNDLITYETLKENNLIRIDYNQFSQENKAGLIMSLIKEQPENNLLYQLLRIQDNKEKIASIEVYSMNNQKIKEIYQETLDETVIKEEKIFWFFKKKIIPMQL